MYGKACISVVFYNRFKYEVSFNTSLCRGSGIRTRWIDHLNAELTFARDKFRFLSGIGSGIAKRGGRERGTRENLHGPIVNLEY